MVEAAPMTTSRRFWLAIAILVVALIVMDVVVPHITRGLRANAIVSDVIVFAILAYIVGTIVMANGRLRFPMMHRPARRPRPVRRDPGSASDFINEFERRNRR